MFCFCITISSWKYSPCCEYAFNVNFVVRIARAAKYFLIVCSKNTLLLSITEFILICLIKKKKYIKVHEDVPCLHTLPSSESLSPPGLSLCISFASVIQLVAAISYHHDPIQLSTSSLLITELTGSRVIRGALGNKIPCCTVHSVLELIWETLPFSC